MKTTEKKIYEAPLMEVVAMQNKLVLMAGSFNDEINERTDGGEIGDDD